MALSLPRMVRGLPIIGAVMDANQTFHRWWDQVASSLEQNFNDLEGAVLDIQAAQDAADTATAAAASASSAASTAQSAATSANSVASLTNSGNNASLTATDAGSNSTISISAHTRYYGDGTSVSVNSGSVTTLSYSTLYYVYYSDPSRSGGAVTYFATTSEATAAQTGNTHLVGSITTPAALDPDTSGQRVLPPGIGSLEEV